MQLTNLKKGSMTTAVYFSKMKALGDELAAAGKPVPDDEMVSFILSGLGIEKCWWARQPQWHQDRRTEQQWRQQYKTQVPNL